MPLAPEWQHPFVNVFKLCDVDTMGEFETKGDVREHMDKIIGKKVFKVRGVIPASNYLRVPRTRQQSLGLTGRIIYIQFRATPVKVFAIHIEVVTEDRNIHRVSISNMYSADALKRKSNGVQLPFPRPSHRWCVAAVDLRAALRSFTASPFSHIKSIQLCSWLTVRTMFTSDYKFTLESLPSDMALSHALDTSIFEMVWLPKEPQDAPTMDFMPPPKRFSSRRGADAKSGGGGKAGAAGAKGNADDSGDDLSSADNGSPPPPSPAPPPPPLSPSASAAAASRATPANVGLATVANALVGPAAASSGGAQPRMHPRATTALATGAGATSPVRPALAVATLGVDRVMDGPGLIPDPALELVRVNAFSGEFVRCVVWLPGGNEVAFAAASTVVLMSVGEPQDAAAPLELTLAPPAPQQGRRQGQQRYLLGHTAFVCALAVSSDGGLLASAQEGREALVRLWDTTSCACLAILNGHASGLSCVDISPDVRALAAVGLDAQARQTIALWDISELRTKGKVELVTRHATEFNIKVLRFSAYQEDHLLTAGRDSIRVYRLKGGQLRGMSVRLVPSEKRVTSIAGGVSAALGPNIFTDIAFEAGVGVYGVDAFKVYVSSAAGSVFQVDYTTRNLDCIYQLHTAAINCLVIADGLALTGGDDRLLRAWPLDFRDYLLEAEHEGSVTSLAMSPDALRVVIGTENGSMGCLQITNHAYTTLLRSHCGSVNAVAVDPSRDQFCTVSSDGTLRIWDLLTHAQLYEFDAPGEAVTCIAYHPLPSHHELAAGFENGRLRVFDVPTTTLLQEQQQHRSSVAELVYSPAGDRLYSGGNDGALVVYDVQRLYAPVQYLSAGVRDIKACVAVSADGAYFASVVRDPYRGVTSLVVFHGRTLEPFMRIETDAAAFAKLAFNSSSSELWALTTDRRLDRYELKEGQLVQQINAVCATGAATMALDTAGRYVLTAGTDGLLRLWSHIPLAALRPRRLPPHQAFLGHPSAVLGSAFHRGRVITVGEADCICVWRVTADALASARGGGPSPRPLPYLHSGTDFGAASRATPSTALGPVAGRSDHQLTARVAALGTPAASMASPSTSMLTLRPSTAESAHTAALTAVRVLSPRATSTTTVSITPRPSSAAASPAPAPSAARAAWTPLHSAQRAPSASGHPTSSPVVRSPPPRTQQQQQQQPARAPRVPEEPPRPPQCSWLLGYTPSECSNVAWHAGSGLFAYVVDDMVVLEHLATRQQRYLRGHTQPLGPLAVSPDGRWIAAAPLAGEQAPLSEVTLGGASYTTATAPFADVVVWDAGSGEEAWRLRYHPLGVQALAFSPDGRWLLSLGREPERSVVVWDLAAGLLAAVGRTQRAPLAAAWLWGGDTPAFASVGEEGLLLWTLQNSFLEQRSVPLSGKDEEPTLCTAVATDAIGTILVAEAPRGPRGASAPLWHVDVADAREGVASMVQVAAMAPGATVTALAVGMQHALVATDEGHVVRFSRETRSGTWAGECSVQLDGAVASLSAEPNMLDAVVATSTSTVWFVGMQDASSVPIVCGTPASVQGLFAAPHDPKAMASTSNDGLLRTWRLGPEEAEPTVELQSAVPCTTAAFLLRTADDELLPLPSPHLLGGYADGSLRLFALDPAVELQWALARHPAPVVGVVPHPRRRLLLTASSDGSLAVTDTVTTRLLSYITAFTSGGGVAAGAKSSPRPALQPLAGVGPLQAVAVSPGTGASLTAVAWRNRFVVFATPWDDTTCTPIAIYDCQPADGRQDEDDPDTLLSPDVPSLIAFVGGATKLLTYSSPLLLGSVLVYDYRLTAVVRRVTVPQMVRSLALTVDGSAMLLGGMEHSVFFVHLGSGSTETLVGHREPVTAAAFTADGRHAVTAAGSVLMVWGVSELMERLDPPPPPRTLRG